MTDPRRPQDEEELMKTWHGSPVRTPDPALLTRQIADEVTRFDRRIRRRNAREYVACAILLIWSVMGMMQGKPAAMLLGAVALGVTGYLWWKHRGRRPLDPGADARIYQAAMLKRYDDQIALLTSAKYWYWIPLYLPVIVITWVRWNDDPGRAAGHFAFITAVIVLGWWLNDRFVLRKLKDARARIAAMIEAAV